MKIVPSLSNPINIKEPIFLTIGFFDGVHLGHQVSLKRIKELAQKNNGTSVVLTYEQHPATILRPEHVQKPITSPERRLELFDQFGIDVTIIIPFTKELSQKTAEKFLTELKKVLPFNYIYLGYDGTIGRDRQGNQEMISQLATKMNFKVEYSEPVTFQGEIISSRRIRELLQNGNISAAEQLLGYSINSENHP